MTLAEVLKWIKTLDLQFSNYYVDLIDKKKEKVLGVYNLKSAQKPIIAIGGLDYTSYNIKRISLLIHWNKNGDESERKAIETYQKIMFSYPKQIGTYDINFISMLNNNPIDVGRDDQGICEYVIEFEIYYKRK